jgi:hypothetical protein
MLEEPRSEAARSQQVADPQGGRTGAKQGEAERMRMVGG